MQVRSRIGGYWYMRKIKLSPVQRDILLMLEEAGMENLACIRATLQYGTETLAEAIAGLKRLGFIVEDMDDSLPALSLTKRGKAEIRSQPRDGSTH
jgi:hypothetical protein